MPARRSKFSLVVFSLVLFILLLESGARLMFSEGPVAPHAILNHAYLPNQRFMQGGVPCQTNSQGWIESQDIQREKPKDVYRVFYIGDSFVASGCDSSVSAYVKFNLQERFVSHKLRLEIVNAGIASHSPALYYLNLKNYILPFDPDLVVLNIDMTDVYDDYLCGLMGIRDEANEIVAVPKGTRLAQEFIRTRQGLMAKSKTLKMLDVLGQYSRFVRQAISAYNYYQDRSTSAPINSELPSAAEIIGQFDWCHEPWSQRTEALVQESMRNIRRIGKMLNEEGIRVVLTGVPHLGHFTGEYSMRPFETLRQVSEENGMVYLDSFLTMRRLLEENDPSTIYFANDMHLNFDGNKIWAKAHAEALLDPRNKLLPQAVYSN